MGPWMGGSGIGDVNEKPLKWTARGNWPLDQLVYTKAWEFPKGFIVFREFWHFEDGELASNNVHMYALEGLPAIGAQQANLS